MSQGRRRRPSALRLLSAACVVTVTVAAAGFPVYVRPQIDGLRHADAILVLGGPDYSRYTYGFQLAAEGWAPNLVISNPGGADDQWLVDQCAATHDGFRMHCFLPDPATTRGEGRTLRELGAENNWHTVIVVTIRSHISRARYILSQCFDGELIMVPSRGHMSLPYWLYQYVYQTTGYLRAVVRPGC